MNSEIRLIGGWAIIAMVVLVAGCGGSTSSRRAMYGDVSYHGKKVESGSISFLPKGAGPAASSKVANGKYKFSGSNGPKPGKYDVMISVAPNDDESIKAGDSKNTTIEWTTEIEIRPESPTRKDFQFP